MLLATLVGVALLALSVAAAVAGSVYVGGAVLVGLPVTGALAAFRSDLPPNRVAVALTAPTALLSSVLCAANPSTTNALVWSALAVFIFVAVLLSAQFGRWRRSKVLPSRAARA